MFCILNIAVVGTFPGIKKSDLESYFIVFENKHYILEYF